MADGQPVAFLDISKYQVGQHANTNRQKRVTKLQRCDGRSDTCGSDGQREGKEKMKQANSCFHAWLMVVLENPFKFAHESVR